MKRLTTKWFKKWMKKVNLSKRNVLKALEDLERGLSAATLSAHLYKIRVKREQCGKRSGFRTILVFRKGDRAIFLYGFGKNERDNIDQEELRFFRKLASDLLELTPEQLVNALLQQVLFDLEDGE
jgi:hypothetical protein